MSAIGLSSRFAPTEQPPPDPQPTLLLGDKSDNSDRKVRSSFAEALNELKSRCPGYLDPACWQQCVADASRFLSSFGAQAAALGWTADDLFGLHPMPERPAVAYCRLVRCDCTGLLWLLQGRAVIAITDTAAVIGTPAGGTLTYRKHSKLAFGLLGAEAAE